MLAFLTAKNERISTKTTRLSVLNELIQQFLKVTTRLQQLQLLLYCNTLRLTVIVGVFLFACGIYDEIHLFL